MSKSFDKVPFPASTFEDQDTLALSSVMASKGATLTEPTEEDAVAPPSRKKGKKGPLTRILLAFSLLFALGVATFPFYAKFLPLTSPKLLENLSAEDHLSDEIGLQTADLLNPSDPTLTGFAETDYDFGSLGNNPPGFADLSNMDAIDVELIPPLDDEFDDFSVGFPDRSLTQQAEMENGTDMVGFPEQNQTDQTSQNTQTAQLHQSDQSNPTVRHHQATGPNQATNPAHSLQTAGFRNPANPQQGRDSANGVRSPYQQTSVTTPSGTTSLDPNGGEMLGSPYSPIDSYTETTNPPEHHPVPNHPVPNQQVPNQQVANQQVANQQVNPAHGSPYRPTNSVVNPAVAPPVQPFSQQIVVTNQQIAPAQSQQNWTGRNRDRHLPETTYPITESDQNISPYQPQQTVAMNTPAVQEERNVVPMSTPSMSSTTAPNAPHNGEEPNPYAPSRSRYQLRYARTRTNESGGMTLPNTHGQLWCEYDITPYTKAVGVVPGMVPEQTIVDWILRQTGEKNWHAEPFSILSANSETLYVYNTPEMQELVAEIVDRFVNPKTSADGFALRIVALSGANWMTQGHSYLKPIRIDSPGVNGWLLEKEDQARLLAELTRRSDYKELCSPQYSVTNGRPQIVSASVPKNYIRDAQTNGEVWPGYGTESAVINEGYNVTFVPLSGIDEVSADMMIRCEILQVERFNPVVVNVPSQIAPRQRVSIDAPQMSSFQLDEQIRWPKDKVLLLDLGTIPLPSAAGPSDAGKLIPEISRRIAGNSTNRGNVLIFVECRKQ